MPSARKKMPHVRSRILVGLLTVSFMLTAASCAGDEEFSSYTKALFVEELCSDTLTMHYTLSDPASYDITDYPVTLGDFSADAGKREAAALSDIRRKLSSFSHRRLSDENDLTLDVLDSYVNTQIGLSDYALYREPLLPSGGSAVHIPLLLSEYKLKDLSDVNEYLSLLAQLPDYLDQLLLFEQKKANSGLFMSDALCQTTLAQLETYIESPNDHALLLTFQSRIKELGLPDDKAALLVEKNRLIFEEKVLPAYKKLIAGLSELMGSGRNSSGLCNLPEGKRYYEQLAKACTGMSASVEDMKTLIEDSRTEDFAVCANLIAAHPQLLQTCDSYEWKLQDNEQILETLKKEMQKDFPAADNCCCAISYVDDSLKDYLAPAFYITSPIDDYADNTIYINSAADYPDIYYFTTLAHEGLPGHMYQTIMSYRYGLPAIRSILNFPGFTEGWATYVELLSFSYAGLDDDLAALLMHNQSATLSLYATSDIGIHYDNWDDEKLYTFWNTYGVSDHKVVDSIRDLILADPGNYLKYYVGYLNFRGLRRRMEQTYGDSFSVTAFHEALLRIGPAPFSVVEDYLDDYYRSAADKR